MPALPVSRRAVALGTSLAVVAGVLVATASAHSPDEPRTLVAAAETTRAALPAGSSDRSRAGLERTALRLAALLDAVPMREGDDDARFCPADALRVQWDEPADGYEVGAFLAPVGPAPTAETEAVNGIVLCSGVDHAYMGFEARWNGSSWDVAAIPALSDEHEHELREEQPAPHVGAHVPHGDAHAAHGDAQAPHPAPAPHGPHPGHGAPRPAAERPAASASSLSDLAALSVGGIDPYARYDPQRTCDPAGKPGMLGLRDLLLRAYPGTRSLGVSRTCTARGVSEHKEGRAFDWGVNVGVPAERAAADTVLRQLLATDSAGNRHALARRLGVMYMIWNRQIWSAYSAGSGWRPYSGASPHTDHVHISLSWDGAMGRTSFWRGDAAALLRLDPELRLADPGTSGAGTAGTSSGSRTGSAVAVPAKDARSDRDRDRDRDDGDAPGRPTSLAEGAPAWAGGGRAAWADEQRSHGQERRHRRKAAKEAARREEELRAASASHEQTASPDDAVGQGQEPPPEHECDTCCGCAMPVHVPGRTGGAGGATERPDRAAAPAPAAARQRSAAVARAPKPERSAERGAEPRPERAAKPRPERAAKPRPERAATPQRERAPKAAGTRSKGGAKDKGARGKGGGKGGGKGKGGGGGKGKR